MDRMRESEQNDGVMSENELHMQDTHESSENVMERSQPLDLAAVRAKLQAKSGKQYWRTLEELSEDPQFEELLHKEFPRQAPSEWDERTAASVVGLEIGTSAKGKGEVVHVAKIKRADRLRALDMLARHHSLYNDRLEIKGLEALSERLARAKARKSGDGGAES